MTTNQETKKFAAETQQLLDIVVHSLYSAKEVFLRELISNASDALDKLRFASLTNGELLPEGYTPRIRLLPDPAQRKLTVWDNGIGMSRDEVIDNLGTIARSGTKHLIASLRQQGGRESAVAQDLIGQFGVGFYSCIMVSKRVRVTTRKAGEQEATVWDYRGGDSYTVSAGERPEQGTTVELWLKDVDVEDGIEDFTDEWVLRRIVKRYSDFVRYPIELPVVRTEKDGDAEKQVEKVEVLNSQKAIWKRAESEVTDEERNEFYKQVAGDWTDPLLHILLKAEGRLEFTALLFIPSTAPFNLYAHSYKRGLQLYARNVKIMDACEEVLPEFLRFVKGVLDAQDLPLNISRETLQNNRQLAAIRSAITKKVLGDLKKLRDTDKEKFDRFWKQFGPAIKEGVSTDPESKERIVPLLQFATSTHPDAWTSLAEYKQRMQEGQEAIYYVTAETKDAALHSPHMEAFAAKGIEVLLFTDPIDDFMVAALTEYEGLPLRSVGKGEVELGTEEEKKKLADLSEEFADLLSALHKPIEEWVSEVRLSSRLAESPACLVGEAGSLSPHVERLMRQANMEIPARKRILEINPKHPAISTLKEKFAAGMDTSAIEDAAHLLLGQALLAESSPLPDPVGFARRLGKLLTAVIP